MIVGHAFFPTDLIKQFQQWPTALLPVSEQCATPLIGWLTIGLHIRIFTLQELLIELYGVGRIAQYQLLCRVEGVELGGIISAVDDDGVEQRISVVVHELIVLLEV